LPFPRYSSPLFHTAKLNVDPGRCHHVLLASRILRRRIAGSVEPYVSAQLLVL
jgi:hypothetical protein